MTSFKIHSLYFSDRTYLFGFALSLGMKDGNVWSLEHLNQPGILGACGPGSEIWSESRHTINF